jgi:transposase
MDILVPRCAGLDVHKETVVACVRRSRAGAAPRPQTQTRTFGTHTSQLLALADWLAQEGVTHVAMESTGVYWRPIWNILEGRFTTLLVNARHIKQVPGRKTDVKDSSWIAQLLQHGLLRGSFVPPFEQRQLRELTRQRRQIMLTRASVAARIQKVLEDANIKLASVATDILGKSGRAMLEAIVAGDQSAEAMAELARGRMRSKVSALRQALQGRVTVHHRFLLRGLLDQVDQLDQAAARLTSRIEAVLPTPFREARGRLSTIPGLDTHAAECILAEIGVDMATFPSAGHLASWAGVCPGQHESAGKRMSGRTNPGNRWLRVMLVQAAWAASRTKDTYMSAQFRRLAGRRGRKRALMAVGHTLLTIIYHVLKAGTIYRELGADYLDRLDERRTTRSLVNRLEQLGHRVTLEPITTN